MTEWTLDQRIWRRLRPFVEDALNEKQDPEVAEALRDHIEAYRVTMRVDATPEATLVVLVAGYELVKVDLRVLGMHVIDGEPVYLADEVLDDDVAPDEAPPEGL